MELKKQVCSLELAKKLEELGVKQDSLFYFNVYHSGTYPLEELGVKQDSLFYFNVSHSGTYPLLENKKMWGENIKIFSAFTVAELGEMLPASMEFYHFETSKYIAQDDCFRYSGGYYNLEGYTKIEFIDKNEANLRAKILIYLLENKLIEAK